MKFISTAHIVFGLFEIGEHVVISPAAAAERSPIVVIPAIAADIDHGIDSRGSAQAPPARLVADPSVQAFLRNGFEPVILRVAQEGHEAGRLDQHAVVPTSGLQQADVLAGLRQPPRNGAPAAAAANHDDIEFVHGYSSPPERLGRLRLARNRVFR